MNCNNTDNTSFKSSLSNNLDVFIDDLDDTEDKLLIKSQKEKIVEKLMAGKFKDLGGLTAMRGFIYQYYVSIYHMIAMINPTQNTKYHSVILEYFDDITLIGEDSITFIQVKTVKNKEGKKHIPSQFIKRKSKNSIDEPIEHFNSWIEKNLLNHDLFLTKKSDFHLTNDLKSQFEIVTNTPFDSLEELNIYTNNNTYDIEEDISDDDKLKKGIKKPIDNYKYNFEDYSAENVDFYLKKLYIRKLGSIEQLEKDIKGLIEDLVGEDILTTVKAEYVFGKLLALVIRRSHEDNENIIDKRKLIFTASEINEIVSQHLKESYELVSLAILKESALSMFNKVFQELTKEFQSGFPKGILQDELLKALDMINVQFNESTQKDLMYSIKILNKIFKGHKNLASWDFSETDLIMDTKESIRLLVYFIVFYEENIEVYNEANLMFHEGFSKSFINDPSIIEKMLLTIFHARNDKTFRQSKIEILANISKCVVSKNINQDIFCLVAGVEEIDEDEDELEEYLGELSIVENHINLKSIMNVAYNILFIESKNVNSIFNRIKKNRLSVESFKNIDGLKIWIDKLNNSAQK